MTARSPLRNKIGYARLALRRRFLPVARPEQRLRVLVVSPGGVATTTLIRHLRDFMPVNADDDADGLKHLPRPPGWLDERTKVLFVAGDAEVVRRSIGRRGWIAVQGAKLGSVLSVLLPSPLSDVAFERAVRSQARRWRRWGWGRREQILFLDYDEIWSRVAEIARFLEIGDPGFSEEFPQRRRRISAEELPA